MADSITDSNNDMTLRKQRWEGHGNPGVLQFMGSQRVRHVLATEQQLKNNKVTYTC